MAYKPLKEALASIAESRRTVNGKAYAQFGTYIGRSAVDKKAKRIWAPTREEAEAKVRAFYKSVRRGGEIQSLLTVRELLDARAALDELENAESPLSLVECVRAALAARCEAVCGLTVAECVERYLADRNTSELDMKSKRARIGKWAAVCGGAKLADLRQEGIAADLRRVCAGFSETTYWNHFNAVSTFLRWCAKKPRAWIAESPLDGVERRPKAWSEPECIEVEDMRTLAGAVFRARKAHPEWAAYVALAFFCGVRREEIMRIAGRRGDAKSPAARINLETRTASILKPKGYLKGTPPRAFEIPETALAWMRAVDFRDALGRITDRTTGEVYAAARAAGARVPKNCGRHSFITYHVAAYQDLAKTLLVAGTGQHMAEDHYRALRSRDEGLAYFAITPEAVAAAQGAAATAARPRA